MTTTHTSGPGRPLVELTTTQYSALGDLRRFGRLYPPGPRQLVERGTSMGFSQRTLQALVDAGVAKWDKPRDGCWVSIIPITWKWFINEDGAVYAFDADHQADAFPGDDHTAYDTRREAAIAAANARPKPRSIADDLAIRVAIDADPTLKLLFARVFDAGVEEGSAATSYDFEAGEARYDPADIANPFHE